DAGIPRDHEPGADSDVAVVRFRVPGIRRARMASDCDPDQPAHVWSSRSTLAHLWVRGSVDDGPSFASVISDSVDCVWCGDIYGRNSDDQAACMKRLFIVSVLFLIGCGKKELPVLSNVPDFTLTERSAREVRRDELAGKIWIADFIFTECAGTCPLMTTNMKKLQEALPAEIQFVSFSVDPAHDTQVLKEYADRNGADPKRWLFLTGDK